jgi:hypothetical protein
MRSRPRLHFPFSDLTIINVGGKKRNEDIVGRVSLLSYSASEAVEEHEFSSTLRHPMGWVEPKSKWHWMIEGMLWAL